MHRLLLLAFNVWFFDVVQFKQVSQSLHLLRPRCFLSCCIIRFATRTATNVLVKTSFFCKYLVFRWLDFFKLAIGTCHVKHEVPHAGRIVGRDDRGDNARASIPETP